MDTAIEWHVYHVSDAGQPAAHDTSGGEWFFEPGDWAEGEVFSPGYPTRELAEQAMAAWQALADNPAPAAVHYTYRDGSEEWTQA